MKLQPFVSEADVDEALRLFKVSTMSAALSGDVTPEAGGQDRTNLETLLSLEKALKSRFPIGHRVSEEKMVQELTKNNQYSEGAVRKVLHAMVRRGELEHHMQRRLLVRVK